MAVVPLLGAPTTKKFGFVLISLSTSNATVHEGSMSPASYPQCPLTVCLTQDLCQRLCRGRGQGWCQSGRTALCDEEPSESLTKGSAWVFIRRREMRGRGNFEHYGFAELQSNYASIGPKPSSRGWRRIQDRGQEAANSVPSGFEASLLTS